MHIICYWELTLLPADRMLLAVTLFFAFDQPFTNANNGVDTHGCSGGPQDGLADPVCTVNDTGAAGYLDLRQSLIERGHGIPEVWFSASYTSVADAHRPDIDIVEPNRRAVGEGFRSLAADLVQTVAKLMELITELLDETAFIEVRPPFAMIVNSASVGEERAVELVDYRQFVEREIGWCREKRSGLAGNPEC